MRSSLGSTPVLRVPAIVIACTLATAVAGCGGSDGVSSGATVSVYVGAPLCPGARRELARERGRAGDAHVRAVCLAQAEHAGRLALATVGANARRATEDSTAIAFLQPPGPAVRFSQPILESAGIASVKASSGAVAMGRVLHAIAESDSTSLRDAVREALE